MLRLRWLVIVALALPLRVEATLIARDLVVEGGSVTYPEGITYDTETRLEWLDLPLTKEWSVDAIRLQSLPLVAGWRHATYAEVCGLFEGAAGPINGCSGTLTDLGDAAGITMLMGFLGINDTSDGIIVASIGVFAVDLSGTEYRLAQLADDGTYLIAEVLPYPFPHDVAGPGHFLVRVPEAHSAVLLLVAACALIGRRVR